MNCLELFAGAGGLAMGTALAGFHHVGVVERDRWACETIRENQLLGHPLVADWPLHEQDVRTFNLKNLPSDIDLVAGGPPCQPFSMGGKHSSFTDIRDMFPTTVEIIRCTRPKAFILENVKGLTRASFANYFSYILFQLELPEIIRRPTETWQDHRSRLEREKTSGHHAGLSYEVVPRLINAANFGIPQRRERIFMVGFRRDTDARWCFPPESHSREALMVNQYVSGEYWDHHKVCSRDRPSIPDDIALAKFRRNEPGEMLPWRTVRDALHGLPDPEITSGIFLNHRFQQGAKAYPGHTGSPLDLPAKTLKAGDHGVPGGENMLVKADGSVRYFTVRESARLQTFPDGYEFYGSWTETMRQLGNAVPVGLAQIVASSVAVSLATAQQRKLVTASTQ